MPALARAYNSKVFYYAPAESKQLIENAEVAIQKALMLDPNLAEAHFARGVILWTHVKGFPHELAIQSYKRALSLDPNLDDAHANLGTIYVHIGLFDKARSEVEMALKINPDNSLARFRVGVINLYSGKYEDAISVFKSVPRDVSPSNRDRVMATALFESGRTEEAQAIVNDFLKTYPKDEGGSVTSVKAMLLAKAGKRHEAEQAIQHAIKSEKILGIFIIRLTTLHRRMLCFMNQSKLSSGCRMLPMTASLATRCLKATLTSLTYVRISDSSHLWNHSRSDGNAIKHHCENEPCTYVVIRLT